MRTTITLEPETTALVEKAMREQGRSFKDVVNEAIRRGLGGPTSTERVRLPAPRDMGGPLVNLDKALHLAGQLEDEEISRKLASGT